MLLTLVVISSTTLFAQEKPIKVVEERKANRLMLYAVNENLQDLDVSIVVEGTNFRQSKAKPRLVRVPATSKVLMSNLVVTRGKEPVYTYELTVNDSLSRRALRKEYELVRLATKKPITVYIPENCTALCDSLMGDLSKSVYQYKSFVLADNPEIKKQVAPTFIGGKIPLDSLTTPVISLGGILHTKIENYDQLMEEVNK